MYVVAKRDLNEINGKYVSRRQAIVRPCRRERSISRNDGINKHFWVINDNERLFWDSVLGQSARKGAFIALIFYGGAVIGKQLYRIEMNRYN